jgi:hypothetical protein
VRCQNSIAARDQQVRGRDRSISASAVTDEALSPVSDEEIANILASAERTSAPERRQITLPAAGGVQLSGIMTVPSEPVAAVIVVNGGSGSSQASPCDVAVAKHLSERGFVTLLIDLLTRVEAEHRPTVFNVPVLAGRLVAVVTTPARPPPCGPRCRARDPGRGGGELWRPSQPGPSTARRDRCPHPADRRKPRRRGAGAQPAGRGQTWPHQGAQSGSRCDPSLRRAWRPESAAALAAGWFVRYLGKQAGPGDLVAPRPGCRPCPGGSLGRGSGRVFCRGQGAAYYQGAVRAPKVSVAAVMPIWPD